MSPRDLLGALVALGIAGGACDDATPRSARATSPHGPSQPAPAASHAGPAAPAEGGERPRPEVPTTAARAPAHGERALWALQDRLAAVAGPLRAGSRLPLLGPRAGVAPVRLRLGPTGRTWTARLMRCAPPAEGDCHGTWEDGVCECAVLSLRAGPEHRSLVVAETAALGRVRLQAVPRPGGGAALWLAADLFDRGSPWPRVGLLVDGDDVPRLALRAPLGTCAFEARGDPEEERAPADCTPAETAVRFDPDGALVVSLPGGERTWPGAASGHRAATAH